MNRLPPEMDGCVPAVPRPPGPDDDLVAAAELKTPKPLETIEDACLDEIHPQPVYPWA